MYSRMPPLTSRIKNAPLIISYERHAIKDKYPFKTHKFI